jgi:hypothetical protein
MAAEAPFFIVGVPRSGTTLLRQMLRGHPRLAVPPESHFVPDALSVRDGAAALQLVVNHERFARWELDPNVVRARASDPALTPADVVRIAFECYAEEHGRPRWGDKTPAYVLHMPMLAAAFPGAQFVHIVRDGREVAASWHEAWWGPDDVLVAAHQWRRMIRRAATGATRLAPGRYLEVRYDRLVAEPTTELARILAFLGEDMVDGLLDYTERSAADIPDLPREHRHLLEPPRQQVRDWRAGRAPAEQERVEAVVASGMRRLGMDGPHPSPLRRADAELRLLPHRTRARAAWLLRGRRH